MTIWTNLLRTNVISCNSMSLFESLIVTGNLLHKKKSFNGVYIMREMKNPWTVLILCLILHEHLRLGVRWFQGFYFESSSEIEVKKRKKREERKIRGKQLRFGWKPLLCSKIAISTICHFFSRSRSTGIFFAFSRDLEIWFVMAVFLGLNYSSKGLVCHLERACHESLLAFRDA